MRWLAGIVVVVSALYLLGLGVVTLAAPRRAEAFLSAFASSARAHYIEHVVRLLGGLALVSYAPAMKFSRLFWVFGWIMVVTSVGLLLLPWRWHRRFAEWVVPSAIRHIKIFALGAFALGGFVLYSAWPL